MNSSSVQMESKISNKSPHRVSRGSQTPKKKNKTRNEKQEILSQESTIEPCSVPPPANTPKAASIIDSNYSASMYSTYIYGIKNSIQLYLGSFWLNGFQFIGTSHDCNDSILSKGAEACKIVKL